MSWMPLLYKTYENVIKGDVEELLIPLLPIAHTTQNADVEVSISIDGEFISSTVVEGDKKTLIPCTEQSASRSGKFPVSHPLCDKLQYLAGDYTQFGGEKGERFHSDYMERLRDWCRSEYSNQKVEAIYSYLQKGTLIADLVRTGTLISDENHKLLKKWNGSKNDQPKIFKILVGSQTDAFVRFRVSGGAEKVTAVWQDKKLHQDYISYYLSKQGEKSFCYVTGEYIPCSNNHPSKLRNTGDKAKLISANDSSGFTYRGRFTQPEQAVSVGYEVSQKAHNALKWLIEKQGKRFGDKVFLLWGTENQKTVDITADSMDIISAFYDDEEDNASHTDTKEGFAKRFNQAISGYKAELKNQAELALIALDSATTGRLSIVFYREYHGRDANELIDRIQMWHESCTWHHCYKSKEGRNISSYGAPSPKDIATIVYGTEQNGWIKADDKIMAAAVERILPCICDSVRIPRDIVFAAVKKAYQPQNYKEKYNWYKVLSITCSLYRKYRYDYYEKEHWTMDVNIESTDITYNCGRLLAVADAIESRALKQERYDKDIRPTNAMRYFTKFSQNPCKTWEIIRNRLNIYERKLGELADEYRDMMADISSRINWEEFKTTKNLDGRMALGFDAQRQYILLNIIKKQGK